MGEELSSGAAGGEMDDIVHRTLSKKDLNMLLQSQPAEMLSDDDSDDSSFMGIMKGNHGNGMDLIARTPDKVPDKNHNTKRPDPIPTEEDSDDSEDHFGV